MELRYLLSLSLVGGAFTYATGCGLWFWYCSGTSAYAWAGIGARLLIKIRDLVCLLRSFRLLLLALVGGRWTNGLNCGLWCWNCNETSSNAWTNIGARPLILRIGI